nr:MAG TPA: hypothetical protein [Caudoviricetes sp.]
MFCFDFPILKVSPRYFGQKQSSMFKIVYRNRHI